MNGQKLSDPNRVQFSPTGSIVTIVLLYAAVSAVWIVTSDKVVELLFHDRSQATGISIIKGLLFVTLTSALLYFLLRRLQRLFERASDERVSALALLEAISENSTDAFFAKDADGRYILCNRAAVAVFGRPRSQIIGKLDTDLFPPDEARENARSDEEVMASRVPATFEQVLSTAAGARFFETIKGPLLDARGDLLGVFGISRDATARKSVAEDMENTVVELAATLKAIPDILFDLDELGTYKQVWASNPDLLMKQRELVLGRRVQDVLPPEPAKAVMEAIAEANSSGSSSGHVIQLPLPTGNHWFELSTAKKGIDKNGVAHFVMISRDVTRRFEAEATLSQNQEHLRLLFTHAPAALAMFDKMMRYLTVSDRWLSDYKLNRNTIVGRSHYEVFPDLPAAWKEAHIRALAGEVIKAEEDRMILPDGSELWLRWEIRPWRHADESVGGIVIFTEDITDRKAADLKITNYVAQIERLLRGSLQIVANAVEKRDPYTSGHEKRVGLIAVDIAREMGWSEDQCKQLEMIGLVHDVGKIGIPAEILTKPTRLTPVEFGLMKEHPQMGYDILADVDFPTPVAEIVRQHHERLDGSGYPRGLKGDEIYPEARIITVADVLESMASHRLYRPALGIEVALRELEEHSGTWYDPVIVETVVRMIRERGYQLPTK